MPKSIPSLPPSPTMKAGFAIGIVACIALVTVIGYLLIQSGISYP